MKCSFILDAEFCFDTGDMSYAPMLSTDEILDRLESLPFQIRRIEKDRRFRDDTRARRIAELFDVLCVLIAELCKRNRGATRMEV